MCKIILNTKFTTLNEYINLERSNKFKAAKLKKKLTNIVAFLSMQDFNKCKIETKKDVIITWFKPNSRQDHDNISFATKFVLDGLVKSGTIKNDSPKYIGNIMHKFEVDKSRSYVSCIVEFVDKIKY